MIGDVLTSSILFEPLKEKFPNAEIHYVLNSHTVPVVEKHPFVDKFIFVTPKVNANKLMLFKFIKQLRNENYDIVIDVYGKISSLLMTAFSGAKIKIGYKKYYTKLIYDFPVERRVKALYKSTLAIEHRMQLLEPLDIPFENVSPQIYLQEDELKEAKNFLSKGGLDIDKPLYMISVLGSGLQKTYPFKYMAKLLDTIVNVTPEAQLLFNYIPSQKEDAEQVYNYCKEETKKQIYFDVFGKSLREFIAITKFCKAMIGNEGGAVNMAKALGKPCFIVFSPQISKEGWFSEFDKNQVAVHLKDFVEFGKVEMDEAKKDSTPFYSKFIPDLIKPKLIDFLKSI